MPKTKEKPTPVVAPLPGLETSIAIAPFVAALRELCAIVPGPRSAVGNRFVGFPESGYAVLGLGDVAYRSGDVESAVAWTGANPARIVALLAPWAKDGGAAARVVVGNDRIELGTPDGGRFTVRRCADPDGPSWSFPSDAGATGEVGESLASAIHKASGFASRDSHRRALTYVSVRPREGGSTAAATDTHRLYVGRSDSPVPCRFYVPVSVVPFFVAGAAYEAVSTEESEGEGKPSRFAGRGAVRTPQGFACWSFDGSFPDIDRVIPSEESTWRLDIDLSGDVAIPAVRRAMVYARDNASRIRLSPGDGMVGVSARSEELGEVFAPFAFTTGAMGFEFALNGDYLIHALRTLGGTPHARGTEPSRPLRFDRGEDTVVIMPMSLA